MRKRSEIGNAQILSEDEFFWKDGRSYQELRQSEIEILAKIDLLNSQSQLTDNEEEINLLYTKMDKLYVALKLIEQFGDNTELLIRAGLVLSNVIDLGAFKLSYNSILERNQNISNLVNQCVVNTNSINLNENFSFDCADWWQLNVIDLNYYTNYETGEKSQYLPQNVSISGLTDFATQFKKGAGNLIYTTCDASLLANSKKALYKKLNQNVIRQNIAKLNIGLSLSVQEDLINSGCIDGTGKNVNQAVSLLKEAGENNFNPESKIGELAAAVVTLVIGIMSFCATAAAIIVDIIKTVKARKSADAETAAAAAAAAVAAEKESIPTSNDFLDNIGFDLNGDGEKDPIATIAIAGAALLLLYYFI